MAVNNKNKKDLAITQAAADTGGAKAPATTSATKKQLDNKNQLVNDTNVYASGVVDTGMRPVINPTVDTKPYITNDTATGNANILGNTSPIQNNFPVVPNVPVNVPTPPTNTPQKPANELPDVPYNELPNTNNNVSGNSSGNTNMPSYTPSNNNVSGNSNGNSSGNTNIPSYTPSTYTPSENYTQALQMVQNQLAQMEGFKSQHQDKIDELLSTLQTGRTSYSDYVDKYLEMLGNREAFSYDPNSDALYQNYMANMQNMGAQAMKDTMGQAAALTGGYGSTYATAAANGAYNNYLTQANQMLPEYYNMELNAYNAEGDAMRNMLNSYAMLDEEAYNRQVQSLNNYINADNNAYNRWSDNWAREYQKIRDNLSDARYEDETAYNRWLNNENMNYQLYRDQINDSRYEKEYADSRNDVLWEQKYKEQAYLDSRNDVAWDQAYKDKVYEDSRNDVAWEQAYKDKVYEDSRKDTEWDQKYKDKVYEDSRKDTDWEQKYKQDSLNHTIEDNDRDYWLKYNQSMGLAGDGKTPYGGTQTTTTTNKNEGVSLTVNQMKEYADNARDKYLQGGVKALDKFIEDLGLLGFSEEQAAKIYQYATTADTPISMLQSSGLISNSQANALKKFTYDKK